MTFGKDYRYTGFKRDLSQQFESKDPNGVFQDVAESEAQSFCEYSTGCFGRHEGVVRG